MENLQCENKKGSDSRQRGQAAERGDSHFRLEALEIKQSSVEK